MSSNKCEVCGKPLSPTSGDIGKTCKEHAGKLRSTAVEALAVPDGFIRMSKVCTAGVEQGLKISQIVTACGGDACTQPILDPVFLVTYVGKGKYLSPDVLTKGFALLKAKAAEPKPEKPAKQETAVKEALQAVVKK